MKRSLKLIMAALSALALPILGWAANPTPVLLLDFGTTKATETNSDVWIEHSQTSGGAINPTITDNNTTFVTTTSKGNFSHERVLTNDNTKHFNAGSYVGLDGVAYDTIFKEMAASLGLTGIVNSTIATDGLGNAGQTGAVITVGNLNVEKTYVMYYIGGGLHPTNSGYATGGFTLNSGYQGAPKVAYVATATHTNTSVATSYQTPATPTTRLVAGGNAYLLVRVSYIKPSAEGKIAFTLSGSHSGINAFAIAEIDPLPFVTHNREINSADETWNTASEWTNSTLPTNADVVNLTAAVEGAKLNIDTAAEIAQLTIGGDYALTVTGDETLTASTTVINTNTDVSGVKASLGAVSLANSKELKIGSADAVGTVFGTGTLVTAGDMTVAASKFSSASVGLKVASGTFTQGTSLGARAIEVASGATFDASGYADYTPTSLKIAGTFTNTRATITDNFIRYPNIQITGDAVISGTYDFGTTKSGYDNQTIPLNGYTLTKTGANNFKLASVTFRNTSETDETEAGTVKVEDGTLSILVNSGRTNSGEYANFVVTGGTFTHSGTNYTMGSLSSEETVEGVTTVEKAGTVTIGSNTLTVGGLNKTTKYFGTVSGTGSIVKVGTGTLDMSEATVSGISATVNGGVLILPAGSEGGATIADGATLQLVLSAEQLANTYTSTPASGTVTFVTKNEDGTYTTISEGVDGNSYANPTVATWTPTSATSTLADAACWNVTTVPVDGNIIVNTAALDDNIAVRIPDGFDAVTVTARGDKYTKITVGETPPALSLSGMVSLPPAILNDTEKTVIDNVTTLLVDTYYADPITRNLACNIKTLNTSTEAGTATISGVISGNGELTVVDKTTLVLTAENTWTGNVTIDAGGTLDVSGDKARLFKNEWGNAWSQYRTVTIKGTLVARAWHYSGALGALASNSYTVHVDGGKIVFPTGSVDPDDQTRGFTVKAAGATLEVPADCTFYHNGPGDGNHGIKRENSGVLTLTGAGSYKFNRNGTVAGTTVLASGTTVAQGRFEALTLNDGAILDVTNGALEVTGVATQQGKLFVKVKAEAVAEDIILAGGNNSVYDAASITILDRTDVVAAVSGNSIVLAAPATANTASVGGEEYATIEEALDAVKLATDKTITIIANTDEAVVLPQGVKLVIADGVEYTGAVTDEYGTTISLADGAYECPVYEASITVDEKTTGYATLQAAVNAAKDGETIQVLITLALTETLTLNDASKSITIDLNTTMLSSTAATAIQVTNGTLTLTNGAITATAVVVQLGTKNGATTSKLVVLDGCSLVSMNYAFVGEEYVFDGDNVVLMYGSATLETAGILSTSSTEYAAIQGSGGDSTANTSITISGGSVTAANNHAIYHPQPGTLTITDGTISGKTGIEMRAGTLDMVAGTVTATGDYVAPGANSNGSTVEGAAIVLSQHTTGEAVVANIEGGTITATGTDGKTFVVANTTGVDPVDITATIAAGVTIDIAAAVVLIDTLKLEADETTGDYTLVEVEVENAAAWAALEALVDAGKLTKDKFDSIKTITNPDVATVIVGCGADVKNGVATFIYEFKVTDISINEEGEVSVTVSLGDGQTFAKDAVVYLDMLDTAKDDLEAPTSAPGKQQATTTFEKGEGTQLFKVKVVLDNGL